MTLRRSPISEADRATILQVGWRKFTADEVIIIIEAWNADHSTAEIGVEIDKPATSIAVLLGQLGQKGITLRSALAWSKRPPAERMKGLTADQLAAMEEQYIALRKDGAPIHAIMDAMALTYSQRDRLEEFYIAQTHVKVDDQSCPKFADHGRHVAKVMDLGGFGAFTEKRLPSGGVACVLPVVYPARAA